MVTFGNTNSGNVRLTCVNNINGGKFQMGSTAGGANRGQSEWILTGVSGPINYIARVINVAGNAKDTTVGVEFYEKNPGYP